MSYNFEFVTKVPELIIYHEDLEQLEVLYGQKNFDECCCKAKQIIENITNDSVKSFGISINTVSMYSYYWFNSEEWKYIVYDEWVIDSVCELIRTRNMIEHHKEKVNKDNALNAIKIIKIFLIRICEAYNLNVTCDESIIEPEVIDVKAERKRRKKAEDQIQSADNKRKQAEEDLKQEAKNHNKTKEELANEKQKHSKTIEEKKDLAMQNALVNKKLTETQGKLEKTEEDYLESLSVIDEANKTIESVKRENEQLRNQSFNKNDLFKIEIFEGEL